VTLLSHYAYIFVCTAHLIVSDKDTKEFSERYI